MFRIMPDNKIKLTKGDTATIRISAVDANGNQYAIKATDVVTMKVRRTAVSTPLISKTAVNNVIVINSSDTSSLDAGAYVYDIQLVTQTGATYTIIPLNFFDIEEEVS